MTSPLTEPAPAKVNLALSVGPPRQDSLHPICSWMVTVDLLDEVHVTALAPGSISRYAVTWHDDARRRSDIDWPIADDLAVRAHLELERVAGRTLPVQAHIEKRIPVGAGLGGGSADAAAMLRAVNRIYELGLDQSHLRHIGAGLGADVPFQLDGGAALVQGVGDDITPLDGLPDTHLVLVLPDVQCRTADIYRQFDQHCEAVLSTERVEQAMRGGGCFNDLATPAFDLHQDLRHAAEAIEQVSSRPVHVSGSGSTLFVTCDTSVEADALAAGIEDHVGLPALSVHPSPSALNTPSRPNRS